MYTSCQNAAIFLDGLVKKWMHFGAWDVDRTLSVHAEIHIEIFKAQFIDEWPPGCYSMKLNFTRGIINMIITRGFKEDA